MAQESEALQVERDKHILAAVGVHSSLTVTTYNMKIYCAEGKEICWVTPT